MDQQISEEKKAGHTPGPWVVYGSQGTLRVRAGDIAIAKIWAPSAQLNKMCGAPDDKANARLIAAAPEMLEALDDLYREAGEYADVELVGDQGLIAALKRARAAIAKARGES